MAISRYRPDSVYELAKYIEREPHHVLKDCNSLKAYGMIHMEPTGGKRNQIRPMLTFKYDFIKVHSSLNEFLPISLKATDYLSKVV